VTKPRAIALVVRKVRLGELDEHGERRAFWADKSPAEKLAELESLRRMWPDLTGDPDEPIVRVVHRRKLGDPPIARPSAAGVSTPGKST
jgi:hypothetical protein